MNMALRAVVIVAALICTSKGKVEVKDNSYTGLVVAINPEIEEDADADAFIDRIKSAWTDASRDLFRATRNRVYFKSITILVPKTWTGGNYNLSNGETYQNADVIIADQNPVYGDKPYTLQFGQCGEQGSYIHLTPGYLTKDQAVTNYGPRGKTLVREWAHYRWGVFHEKVTSGYDPFYLSRTGKVEANRCPLAITGDNYYVDSSTGSRRDCKIETENMLPEDGCVFYADEARSSEASTSLMSYHDLYSVYTFCHDDTADAVNLHNRAAPNEQNRLCNLRSTWDVITDSADFGRNDTAPNDEIEDTAPTFDVVRPDSYERFVLVLDTSGSMDGNRMVMMRQAASTFILQAAPPGSDIAIVRFATTATTISDLTRIDIYSDRQALSQKLPTVATGGTSIGSGILEALKVLNKDCDTNVCTNGGTLIVLSDGEENQEPTLSMVNQSINDAGVRIDSMVFSSDADPLLQKIARDTGGIWYFSDENKQNSTSALTDAFVTVAKNDDGDCYREYFQIHSSSFTVEQYSTHTGEIIIDQTIGSNTVFTFAWSQYDIVPEVVLAAPDGCTYSTDITPGTACEPGSSPSVDVDFKMITFPISGTAQAGTWKYNVTTTSAFSQNMVATATSMASNRDVRPIIVKSGIGNVDSSDGEGTVVYAQVSMGYAPVLNANVKATVDGPTGGPVTIELKDKGAAPDVRENDGIYSRYFTHYNGPGRYSVQVKVIGVDGQTTSAYDTAGSNAASRLGFFDGNGNLQLNLDNAPVTPPQTATGIFSRVTSAGGFSFSGTMGSDAFPPSRIQDLAAKQENTSIYNSGIRLTFTAPGADFDSGIAKYYDIRYTYGDLRDLITNFSSNGQIALSNASMGSPTYPQEAGSEESFLVLLPDLPEGVTEQTVGFAIRAVDDAANQGPVSNVASVHYFIEPIEPPTSTSKTEPSSSTDVEFILMIAIPCTAVLLLVAVGVLLYKRRKADNYDTGSHTVEFDNVAQA